MGRSLFRAALNTVHLHSVSCRLPITCLQASSRATSKVRAGPPLALLFCFTPDGKCICTSHKKGDYTSILLSDRAKGRHPAADAALLCKPGRPGQTAMGSTRQKPPPQQQQQQQQQELLVEEAAEPEDADEAGASRAEEHSSPVALSAEMFECQSMEEIFDIIMEEAAHLGGVHASTALMRLVQLSKGKAHKVRNAPALSALIAVLEEHAAELGPRVSWVVLASLCQQSSHLNIEWAAAGLMMTTSACRMSRKRCGASPSCARTGRGCCACSHSSSVLWSRSSTHETWPQPCGLLVLCSTAQTPTSYRIWHLLHSRSLTTLSLR